MNQIDIFKGNIVHPMRRAEMFTHMCRLNNNNQYKSVQTFFITFTVHLTDERHFNFSALNNTRLNFTLFPQ